MNYLDFSKIKECPQCEKYMILCEDNKVLTTFPAQYPQEWKCLCGHKESWAVRREKIYDSSEDFIKNWQEVQDYMQKFKEGLQMQQEDAEYQKECNLWMNAPMGTMEEKGDVLGDYITSIPIKIQLIHPNAKIPTKATPHSAGYDVYAVEDKQIESSSSALVSSCIPFKTNYELIPLGFKVEIPVGYEIQIRPRSGLALKYGVTCLNSPGTIDADYRGEVGVILINHGTDPYQIKAGDRIGQMVIAKVITSHFKQVEQLSQSQRGEGGYGSSGK